MPSAYNNSAQPAPREAHVPLLVAAILTLVAVNPATPFAWLFGTAAAALLLVAVARAQPRDPVVVGVRKLARLAVSAAQPPRGGRHNARATVRVIAVVA